MKQFTGFQRGINLGGWLSQCKLTEEHFKEFITEADIEQIAQNDFDHVRIPVDYEALGFDGAALTGIGIPYLDSCSLWCKKHHLNILIDLHSTRGYNFGHPDTAIQFFQHEEDMNYFIGLWTAMAVRYGNEKHIAFDLLNEMVLKEAAQPWNDLASKTTMAIRNHAKEVPIVIGGVRYNHVSSVKQIIKPPTDHIVFNFHCYEPFYFTHQGAGWTQIPRDFRIHYPDTLENQYQFLTPDLKELVDKNGLTELNSNFFTLMFQDAVEAAAKADVALYCGEYGVIEHADRESVLRWFADINRAFAQNGIGRASWNYKKMDFGMKERDLLSI